MKGDLMIYIYREIYNIYTYINDTFCLPGCLLLCHYICICIYAFVDLLSNTVVPFRCLTKYRRDCRASLVAYIQYLYAKYIIFLTTFISKECTSIYGSEVSESHGTDFNSLQCKHRFLRFHFLFLTGKKCIDNNLIYIIF